MASGSSFGRTFRPSSYIRGRPMPVRQASGGGTSGQAHLSPVHPRLQRTASTSSVVSAGSGYSAPGSPSWPEHSDDEAQFLMSGTNTPRTEHPPPYAHSRSRFSSNFGSGRPQSRMADDDDGVTPHYKERKPTSNRQFRQPQQLVSEPPTAGHSSISHPIAIESPPTRRFRSAPVYSPLEPLSARGDVPGGYFPNHEDPATRIHRPHPFHSDTLGESFSLRNMPSVLALQPPSPFSQGTKASSPSAKIKLSEAVVSGSGNGSSTKSNAHTPLMSYLPSGSHDIPLPMGKYYPSNYEQRTGSRMNSTLAVPTLDGTTSQGDNPTSSRNASRLKPPTRALPSGTRSDSVVPKYHRGELHPTSPPQDNSLRLKLPSRSPSPGPSPVPRTHAEAQRAVNSDAGHRLRQYQCDMIAQARLAANGLLQKPGGGVAPATLRGLPIKHLSLDGSLPILGGKPISPRLAPLGSPIGPVTPMELEDGGGGYLTKGRAEIPEHLKLPAEVVAKAESKKTLQVVDENPSISTAEKERQRRRQERNGETVKSVPGQ